MTVADELRTLSADLRRAASGVEAPEIKSAVAAVRKAVDAVAAAASGSWLGYHARVYYVDFAAPPPGAHFSVEWGLDRALGRGTTGDWREYSPQAVLSQIATLSAGADLEPARRAAAAARSTFRVARDSFTSLYALELAPLSDPILQAAHDELLGLRAPDVDDVVEAMRPTARFVSRDAMAAGQGLQQPPHVTPRAEALALESAPLACAEAAAILDRAAAHLARRPAPQVAAKSTAPGSKVFIGHGRSALWRELKDFVGDRLGLAYDEFNRVPVAGVPNTARLAQMLDDAAIGFLVMTAEDERADGAFQPRMNVVHEAGLFQGRLGFTRAIILLEDGCEEFSNVQGLGQIRFPKGRISAVFEDIRAVLEREGLLPAKP